jgi:lysophospholipase L1-like esterase
MNITEVANNEVPFGLVQQSQTYTAERFWTEKYCSDGYWLRRRHPAIDTSSSMLAEQAGLPWLWHSECCPTEPLMATPTEMGKLLGRGIKVAYLGDSLMRTTFQAFIDIATNYSSPFSGITTSWCKKNVSKLVINDQGELSIFGDGCWSGGANFTTFTGNSHSTLTYYDRHHSGQSVNDILSETETLDWIFVNYGLHDIGMFTIEQFKANLRDRLMQLKSRRTETGRPSNLVYVGLWAQNVARKPIGWKWSGSNTRASDFIKAMKEVNSELNVPFIDTYHMTLPVLDANRDGVHFNESVTRTIAMLMMKGMQESYSFATSN